MVNDLISHGCVQNKSLKLTCFPELPANLIRHFLRGYFDGDGSLCTIISKHSKSPQIDFGFVGTNKFLQNVDHFLIDNKVYDKETRFYDTGKAKQFSRTGNNMARRFFKLLYTKSHIYLDRKFDIFSAVFGGDTERLLMGN